MPKTKGYFLCFPACKRKSQDSMPMIQHVRSMD